ncbi:hypothetical protein K470DRAFT_262052 [Piedraia hortae CBS 480.64]|uniref:Uncharacterized protein n=1 Tax=Piedraia hortae CBS 480.64 TaxID=1314780 RepID=A0A6A7C847_9PEZI|nr:hypothetical protein K470DRAFT_262052 [Piedraia hortae CBS 480.64]
MVEFERQRRTMDEDLLTMAQSPHKRALSASWLDYIISCDGGNILMKLGLGEGQTAEPRVLERKHDFLDLALGQSACCAKKSSNKRWKSKQGISSPVPLAKTRAESSSESDSAKSQNWPTKSGIAEKAVILATSKVLDRLPSPNSGLKDSIP